METVVKIDKRKLKRSPKEVARIREMASKGGKAKKGVKHKTTIDRENVLNLAKDIIAGRTRKLVDTQTMLALGTIKIFVIKYDFIGKKRVARKPELVTDDETIANVLYHEYADGEDPSDDSEYFFVTTKDPENQAIKDLLDRTFGKATENRNLTIDKGMGAILDAIEDENEEK